MTETTTRVTLAPPAPISDLRRRMLQDMTNRNFGDKTQHDYIRHIETFAKFLGRAPDTATGDDVRRSSRSRLSKVHSRRR